MNSIAQKNGESAAETASGHSPARLAKTRESMIDAGGRLCHLFGMPRSIGHIYGLLFLSNRPLHLEEIAKSLGIAKSSARVSARQLVGWRVIKQHWIPGDQRDYFEIEPDLGSVVRISYNEFFKPRMASSEKLLEQISSTLDTDVSTGQMTNEERDHCADRLLKLQRLQNKVRSCLPIIDQIFG